MSLAFAEGAVTRVRRESKFLLKPPEADRLCIRLERELAVTPEPTTITSVYFDRPGFPLAERALRTPHDCVKVRTKEYDPDVSGPTSARVVLEVKRERAGLTHKRRLWLYRSDLRRGLEQRRGVMPFVLRAQLSPVLAVTYVRWIFQRSRSWRVTVDREVCFHQVDFATALSPHRLTPSLLGPGLASEEKVVVEVKHAGGVIPAWLVSLASTQGMRFSKFVDGMVRLRAFASQAGGGG